MSRKVIVIGANSKSTDNQNCTALQIGKCLKDNDYICIHGGGDGTMLATTQGIGGDRSYIISPENMLSSHPVYTSVYRRTITDNILSRVGILTNLSRECKYIIMYGGGIGTIHELLSFMVYWYKEPDKMPDVLFCNTDAEPLSTNLLNIMLPLCIETRPYMYPLIKKIRTLSTTDVIKIINES